jgi:hypothetical protein
MPERPLADRAMSDAAPRTTPRPALVLTIVALTMLALLVVGAVLQRDDDDVALSSYSARGGGARGLYETAERLGWRVARRTEPLRGRLDTGVVWVTLYPALAPTAAEVHALLESVRGGARLLVALPRGESPLADSLGLRAQGLGVPLPVVGEEEQDDLDDGYGGGEPEAASRSDTGAAGSAVLDTVLAVAAASRDPDPGYRRYAARYEGEVYSWFRPLHPWPEDTVVFLAAGQARRDSLPAVLPVAIGLRVGHGRVVAVAEPRLLVNDELRARGGVLPVRMLEWLAAPGTRPLVFDEFHHGYGSHASLGRAVRRFLDETTPGRTTVVLLLAAALLVLALGARPVAPSASDRVQRRSPIEHVGALARAYEEVGASRLAVRRLARGIRRRRSALGRHASDADWLRDVAERSPAIAGEVKLVLDAMERPLPPERFVRLAPALARIERTLAS